jgi:hypothetical protein
MKDLHLEEKDDEYRRLRNKAIADDAAVLVMQGWDRESALQKAEAIAIEQDAAQLDATGAAETLSEAQSPTAPQDVQGKRQHAAIAAELFQILEHRPSSGS